MKERVTGKMISVASRSFFKAEDARSPPDNCPSIESKKGVNSVFKKSARIFHEAEAEDPACRLRTIRRCPSTKFPAYHQLRPASISGRSWRVSIVIQFKEVINTASARVSFRKAWDISISTAPVYLKRALP